MTTAKKLIQQVVEGRDPRKVLACLSEAKIANDLTLPEIEYAFEGVIGAVNRFVDKEHINDTLTKTFVGKLPKLLIELKTYLQATIQATDSDSEAFDKGKVDVPKASTYPEIVGFISDIEKAISNYISTDGSTSRMSTLLANTKKVHANAAQYQDRVAKYLWQS